MSCNFLNPRLVDMNKNSDTLSEISESETANSGWTSNWDSREELRDFVTKLGLKDVSDLYQDRFRVDRKKLEQMLTGDNDALIPADVFFAKIMEDTDTFITWPNKLKIGAKSKKDPHVRIAGRPEDVQAAKERIMTILDTRCNRVTMKMDVSYTDHSHIIGKGGQSIKRVMEETQCHVHFPDSNRSNPTEKSNQVSISGDIEGVECARSRVRELIPLIFGFELPIMSQNIDGTSAYVIKIQEQYKVQVMFKTRPKLHATLVLVKGVEWEVNQVKQATVLLMEYMCDKLASQIPIQMSMEISPHHHQIVLGKSHSNLKQIMQYTNCQIMFPDASDPNIPSLKKSNVNISGNIHNVYKARQLLMGSLPLIIIFDLPEECPNLKIRPDQINEIQTSCDLVINIRQKAKQNTKACVIKGIERHAVNIYKARNMILGIDEPPITADIPQSYSMNNNSTTVPTFTQSDLLPTPTNVNPPPISPMLSPLVSPNWQFPMSNMQQNASFVGMTQQPQFMFSMLQQSMGSSGYHSMSNFSDSSIQQQQQQNRDGSNYSMSSNSSSISSPLPSPRNSTSPGYRNMSESPSELNADLGLSPKMTNLDYDNKRLAGFRAMQIRPTPGTFRLPNNSWSGYNISHTSPAKTMTRKEDDIWKSPTNFPSTSTNLNNSNFLDQTPSQILNRITSSNWSDLPSMLTSLGLDRYIGLFTTHEIDLTTFTTLNDQDLVEIGINAFGARRKMLLAISEMKKRANSFSAAPGAERKSSSSTSSTLSPRDWYHSMSNFSDSSIQQQQQQQNRDGSNYSMSSNSSSISSPLPSPRNSTSPGYRNMSESPSELNADLGLSPKMTNLDYDNKRLAGFRAMQIRPTPGTFRLPNNSWSGYNISHTSPAKTMTRKEDDIWKSPTNFPSTSTNLNNSNFLDQTPSQILNRITSSNWSDLPSMLTSLGLDRYIGLFTTHEIDLTTFTTLNDQDLVEIGINAFGARRKMLLAISEMKKRANSFSAAPGAERKSSSSTSSTLSPRDWYHSMSNFSDSSIQQQQQQNRDGSNYSMSSNSSSISSPLPSPRNSTSPGYRNMSESPSELNADLGLSPKMTNVDYDNKRLAGFRAMQIRPTPGTFRLPNNSWSGYNISHTSPAKTMTRKEDDIWKSPTNFPSTSTNLNNSNFLDQTPSQILNRITSSNWTDLPSMLTSLGLDRYIGLFTTHEIDLTTFTTLNDQDLVEIGINAFGARRKMLLAISEMKKRANSFSAAPGAERKSSSSTSSTLSPRDW